MERSPHPGADRRCAQRATGARRCRSGGRLPVCRRRRCGAGRCKRQRPQRQHQQRARRACRRDCRAHRPARQQEPFHLHARQRAHDLCRHADAVQRCLLDAFRRVGRACQPGLLRWHRAGAASCRRQLRNHRRRRQRGDRQFRAAPARSGGNDTDQLRPGGVGPARPGDALGLVQFQCGSGRPGILRPPEPKWRQHPLAFARPLWPDRVQLHQLQRHRYAHTRLGGRLYAADRGLQQRRRQRQLQLQRAQGRQHDHADRARPVERARSAVGRRDDRRWPQARRQRVGRGAGSQRTRSDRFIDGRVLVQARELHRHLVAAGVQGQHRRESAPDHRLA